MKKLFTLILLFCFSVVMFADVGKSPPVEKQGIEITITTDFEAFEMPVIYPVVEKGVYFIAESAMVNSFTGTMVINNTMIERLYVDLNLKATKSNYFIRDIIEEGSGGDYSNLVFDCNCDTNYLNGALNEKSFTYDFDYSSNKLLTKSWQSDTTRKNNRFIDS